MAKKSTTKRSRISTETLTLFAAIAALIMSAVALFSLIVTYRMVLTVDASQVDNTNKLYEKHFRLQTCYDNDIHPCDDATIRKFEETTEG